MTDPAKVQQPLTVSSDEDPRPKRRFVHCDHVPEKALRWSKPAERAQQLDLWRCAVGRHFASSPRVIRVAWALEWCFGAQGYAFPTDGFLERKLDVPILKIQAALLELERAGAIIRASVYVRNKSQRRIWPSSELPMVIFPTVGKVDIPHGGVKHLPHGGETESFNKESRFPAHRISATQQAARREAEIRQRAEERRFGGAPDDEALP